MVKVDAKKCIGCGACAAICPGIFEIGSDGKSHVKKNDPKAPCAKQAKESCPVRAISL
ncbi:MAG: ferredoxin [archaeon]